MHRVTALLSQLSENSVEADTTINFSGSGFGSDGIKCVFEWIDATGRVVDRLNMKNNRIWDRGIAAAVKSSAFHALQYIDLRENKLRGEGAALIASALTKSIDIVVVIIHKHYTLSHPSITHACTMHLSWLHVAGVIDKAKGS